MVGIHGASLAGTTTLLYLMMGILKPERGTVLIDGYNLSGWDFTDMKGRVEYIPQAASLFKGTLVDNITMFDPNRHAAALDAAGLVGLDELVSRLPMGYETPVSSQASGLLSSGLIQRVAFARALVVRPRILLLDKASAAMDRDSTRVFRWLLEQLKGRCTIVMVTNQHNLLGMADDVFELSAGRLEESELLALLREMEAFQLPNMEGVID